jgi:hypothetical protein
VSSNKLEKLLHVVGDLFESLSSLDKETEVEQE